MIRVDLMFIMKDLIGEGLLEEIVLGLSDDDAKEIFRNIARNYDVLEEYDKYCEEQGIRG